MLDIIIIGSGFYGSVLARLATDAGKKVMVVEKNYYVGGMAADFKINNILVGIHGGHVIHTNSDTVWNFLNQFSEIIPFINKPKVLSKNKVYSFPINMMTLSQEWGIVTPKEALEKLKKVRIPCNNPNNFEDWILDKIGEELYYKFIYGYTKKHWGREPRELPSSIIQRLPIRLTYDENYFVCKYQGMPKYGYSQLIKNMLSGIKIELGVNFFNLDWRKYAKNLVYSGPIDKFFNYEYGALEYNTLKFEHKTFTGDYQGNAVFNHVDLETPYLRTIENKHFYKKETKHYLEDTDETIVTFDYPAKFENDSEPYYPLWNKRNSLIYDKYKKLIDKNITIGGRLGSYKYSDVDQIVSSAMKTAEKFND